MKVLLFGPQTPPYNGQAIAFTTIVEALPNEDKILVNTAVFRNNVLNTIYSIAFTLYIFIFYKFSTIYFTSSRSNLGFIKDLPLLLLGRWSNKKIINHLHGADFKIFYERSGILKSLIKYAYDGVNISIILLDEMKNEFVEFPKMKIITVANCFADEFNDMDIRYNKKIQLLYLSNLMKSKGILEFLEACCFLLNKNPLLEVKIAGSMMGDSFMDKKSLSSAFNEKFTSLKTRYPTRINYMGVIKGKEKIQILFESSIFVLPSYYPTEAYPISIIEAMRTGNAIITTNHNYLPQIIKSQNGLIVETHSAESIIKGIEFLLQDQIKLNQIQQNNIEEAMLKYSQSRYLKEVKSIILAN